MGRHLTREVKMPWVLPVEKDEAIQKWMKAKGLEVTAKDYDAVKRVYAWLHERPRGKPLILQITKVVLDDNPAFIVLEYLDRLQVAQAIKANPDIRFVLSQEGSGVVLAEESPSRDMLRAQS
jgi:hypothetical protein